ncbi:hypothetical protein B0H12DRAFT_1220186 [Mycena haematopus]|nr:hypothetical protein B0H12DRAFT_1220186 [Mycena haematopus]
MRRPAPYGEHGSAYNAYFTRMPPLHRCAVQSVRLFTPMSWLHNRRERARWVDGLLIPKLTITIRRSDWPLWESGQALHIIKPDTGWGEWVGSVPGLQELQLELESVEEKKEELEACVKVARRWTFPLENGGCLVHDGAPAFQTMWLGSAALATPGFRRVLAKKAFDTVLEERHNISYPFDLKLLVKRITFIVKPVIQLLVQLWRRGYIQLGSSMSLPGDDSIFTALSACVPTSSWSQSPLAVVQCVSALGSKEIAMLSLSSFEPEVHPFEFIQCCGSLLPEISAIYGTVPATCRSLSGAASKCV